MSKLKDLRVSKNLTQIEFAEAIGVERSTVSMWETGAAMPRTHLLLKIADILGCTVDELLRSEEER